MNDAKARRALHEIKTILDRHSVKVWLDCGTLLGAVREGDFIDWDNDIDLAMWAPDIGERDMQPVWRDMHRANFDVYLLDDKLILERGGVPINISIYTVDGEEARRAIYPLHAGFGSKAVRVLWWAAAAKAQKSSVRPAWPTHPVSLGKRVMAGMMGVLPIRFRRALKSVTFRASIASGCHSIDWRVPAEFFDDFRSIAFSDDDWLIPGRSADYLRFRYGADWRMPRRDFSSIRDDGAIRR